MTNVVIIICGLILAFSEKPHLFQRPIKSWKAVLLIVIFGAAIMNFIKGHADDIREDHDTKTIDSLQAASKIQSRLIDTLRKENKDAQVEYAEGLQEHHIATTEALARYGLKMDSLTGSVRKMNFPVDVKPILMISRTPTVFGETGHEGLRTEYSSLNSDSHIVSGSLILLDCKFGKEHLSLSNLLIGAGGISPGIVPKGLSMIAENSYFYESLHSSARSNPFILVIDCYYKSNSGEKQTPLRGFYFINKTDKGFITEESTEFSNKDIEDYLKANGKWK